MIIMDSILSIKHLAYINISIVIIVFLILRYGNKHKHKWTEQELISFFTKSQTWFGKFLWIPFISHLIIYFSLFFSLSRYFIYPINDIIYYDLNNIWNKIIFIIEIASWSILLVSAMIRHHEKWKGYCCKLTIWAFAWMFTLFGIFYSYCIILLISLQNVDYHSYHSEIYQFITASINANDLSLRNIAVHHYLSKYITIHKPYKSPPDMLLDPVKCVRTNTYLDNIYASNRNINAHTIYCDIKNVRTGLTDKFNFVFYYVSVLLINVSLTRLIFFSGADIKFDNNDWRFVLFVGKFMFEILGCVLVGLWIVFNYKARMIYSRWYYKEEGDLKRYQNYYKILQRWYCSDTELKQIGKGFVDGLNYFYVRWKDRMCKPQIKEILIDKYGDVHIIIYDYLFWKGDKIKIKHYFGRHHTFRKTN
eukprot:419209_1